MYVRQSDIELILALIMPSRREIYFIKRNDCMPQLRKTLDGREQPRNVAYSGELVNLALFIPR
jgi:hypothetical protein